MVSSRSPYIRHLFVCVNQRDPGVTCCSHTGGEAILEELKGYVKANGLQGKVRVSKSGCMDLCAQGPNVMVEPDHRWYRHVMLEDVEKIIEKELKPLMQKGSDPFWSLSVPGLRPGTDFPSAQPIRAFLFDLGNVLVQFDHLRAAERIAANAKVTPEELYRLFFESPLIIEHDEGKISTATFFERLKAQIGLSLSFGEFLEIWNGIFTENRPVAQLVRRLLAQYPCYLISNTNRPHFEHCVERYPVLKELTGRILSYEVGVLKPHPKIYRRALELAQIPPSQIFYVDDRADLIEAGRSIGFQVHRFTDTEGLLSELKAKGINHGV